MRLKDVARIELGALTYNQSGRFNGRPAALIAVFQAPGANALTVANGVKDMMAAAQGALPERPRLQGLPRHIAAGHRGDQGDREHPRRGDGPRHPGRLPVPPELARDPDPPHRRAGVPDRHLRLLPASSASRSTRSPSSASCSPSASSWTTRSSWWRRSSTTSRKGWRRATPPCRRCREVSGPVVGHRPRPVLRLHPDRPDERDPGTAQQAVRGDDRDLGADLRVQRARRLSPALSAMLLRPRQRVDGGLCAASSAPSTAASRGRPTATWTSRSG